MRYLGTLLFLLLMASAAPSIAPPLDPPNPAIVPSGGDPGTGKPNGGPTPPPPNAPEPSTLVIAGVSMAAAGGYRMMRGRKPA